MKPTCPYLFCCSTAPPHRPGASRRQLILRVNHPDARRAIVAAQNAQQKVGHGVHLGIEKPQTLSCHVNITANVNMEIIGILDLK